MLKTLNKSFPALDTKATIEILPITLDNLKHFYLQDLQTLAEFVDTPPKLLLYPSFENEKYSLDDANAVLSVLLQSVHLKYEYYLNSINSLTPTHNASYFSDLDDTLFLLGVISKEHLLQPVSLSHNITRLNSLFLSILSNLKLFLPFVRLYKI